MSSKVWSSKIILFAVLLLASWSCKSGVADGNVLASVYGIELTEGAVMKVLGAEKYSNPELKDQFIDSWIRKQLLLSASKNTTSGKNEIDKLVKDYKESLIIQKYKEDYFRKNLKSEISEAELADAYALVKDDYRLKEKIFKAELLITPANHPDKLDLKSFFKKGAYEEWKNSLAGQVDFHLQDTSVWRTWGSIQQYIAYDLLSEKELQLGKNYAFENEEHLFFLRIFDLVEINDTAPLDYMKDRLEQAILEQRKNDLLEEYSTQLYKTALKNNKIKYQ